MTSPQGSPLTQGKAHELSLEKSIIILSGHYEGIDERIRRIVDFEISIGDYILTGGELPAMVVTDAVTRLIPGVLGSKESLDEESFSDPKSSQKEYPQYTRPEDFKGWKVPEILLSGDHIKIKDWRQKNTTKS